jgi:hypothetical protein
LTLHGKKLSEDAFKEVNHRKYEININALSNQWHCCVQRVSSTNQYQFYFKAEEEKGSAFVGCSCGRSKTHGIPCVHMVAVVKSYPINELNPIIAMPLWWMTAHWRKQYPQGADVICNLDIHTLKNASRNTTWGYCPPYTVPNKAGRPKKYEKLKLAIELASEQYIKKKNKVDCNSNKLDGDRKSPHDDKIGEYVTTADMEEDKESAVKKRKRGQAKGGVISTDIGGERKAIKEGKDGEVRVKGDKMSMIRRSISCTKKV